MKFAGVVVWYNPSSDDKENINTYLEFLDKLFIIYNNENKNEIGINSKKINYIFNNDNIGVAKALNDAAKMAIKDGYEWLLTMDQDTKMNKKCFDKFKYVLDNMDTSKIGIITPWHKSKLDTIKLLNYSALLNRFSAETVT